MARTIVFLVAFCVPLLAAIEPVAAQTSCVAGTGIDNSLDQITSLYLNCARQWEATLGRYALSLFWLLAAIEFAWSAIRLALRSADLGEWLGELINQIVFIGLFLALLTNATAWTGAIVESFRAAGAEALRANGVAAGIAPSDIFDTGVNIATKMLEALSVRAPVQSLFVVLAALVILGGFALIAAAIILALVESYVVLSGGVLLMGFGGSRWTKDFAVRTLVYAVSVGAKLFILQLIAGLGAQIVGSWASLPEAQSVLAPAAATANILVIVGSTLVLWVLVKTVPEMIQGLINGTVAGANSGLAAGLANLAGSVYALGMVIGSARELAGEQITEARSTSPAVAPPGLLSRSIANIGSATLANIGHRLSGRAVHGTRLGQLAAALSRDADALRSERQRREAIADGETDAPAHAPPPPASPAPQAPLATGLAANTNTPPSSPE
jgi:type IV secretion system protein TrbL